MIGSWFREKWLTARDRLARMMPSVAPLQVTDAIVQLFIGSGGKNSTYTFINFPSLYSPQFAVPCRYEVSLFDPSGRRVAQEKIDVPVYGTAEVRLEDLFKKELPEFGMVSARILPFPGLKNPYPTLGRMTSHFYAIYSDANARSLAVVHPQSRFGVRSHAELKWTSNLLLALRDLKELEIYQINPSPDRVRTDLLLQDEQGNVLKHELSSVPAYGTRRVVWPVADLQGHENVLIGLNGLTAQNAKPLVFGIFNDATFNACHS
jgi:hypothetical protein